jgi:hypothetical protein
VHFSTKLTRYAIMKKKLFIRKQTSAMAAQLCSCYYYSCADLLKHVVIVTSFFVLSLSRDPERPRRTKAQEWPHAHSVGVVKVYIIYHGPKKSGNRVGAAACYRYRHRSSDLPAPLATSCAEHRNRMGSNENVPVHAALTAANYALFNRRPI